MSVAARVRRRVRIEDPQVIAKILSHLERPAPEQYQPELLLGARAPPVQSSLI